MQPLVAPSAAVPTSRPSKRPLKRRPQSIRPGGKKRPKEPKQDESHPTKTGGVRELMRFLPQSPNQDRDRDMPLCSPTSSTFSWSSSSSAASTATTSAREMLRAGQRRLRRLAQARARAKTSSSSDDESLVREQMERPLEPPALASWRDGDRRPTVAAVEPSTPPSRDGDKLRGDSGDHQERRDQGTATLPGGRTSTDLLSRIPTRSDLQLAPACLPPRTSSRSALSVRRASGSLPAPLRSASVVACFPRPQTQALMSAHATATDRNPPFTDSRPPKPLPSTSPAPASPHAAPDRTSAQRRARPSDDDAMDTTAASSENQTDPTRRVLVPRSPRMTRDSALKNLERICRDRAERVRALRLRDLSASRARHRDTNAASSSVSTLDTAVDASSNHLRPVDHALRPPRSPVAAHPSPPPAVPLPADPPVARSNRSSASLRRTGSSSSSSVSADQPGTPRSVRSGGLRRGGESHDVDRGSSPRSRPRSESPRPSSDGDERRDRRRSVRSNHQRHGSRQSNDGGRHRGSTVLFPDGIDPAAAATAAAVTGRKPSSASDCIAPRTPRVQTPQSQEHQSQEHECSPRSQCSQHTAHSHDSRASQSHHGHDKRNSLHPLEARIAVLERQNKMLQAALLAALDMGVTYDADCVRSGLPTPSLMSSASPTTSAPPSANPLLGGLAPDEMSSGRRERGRASLSRPNTGAPGPDSWDSVQDQNHGRDDHHHGRHHDPGRRGSCASGSDDASVRELEAMMGDLEMGWRADGSGGRRDRRS